MALTLPNVQVIAEFFEVVPEDFLYELTSGILKGYELCENEAFPGYINPKFRKQYRPLFRKGIIDSQIDLAAKKHFNISDSIRDNCTGSHSYTELIIEKKVILTASVVDSPSSLPRRAKFRSEAAMNNPGVRQLDLFSPNVIPADFNRKNNDKKLYGIIIHGPSKSKEPEFIIIVIPDFSYSFGIGTINLLERYSKRVKKTNEVDLSVQEITKPSAQLRIREEEFIEDEDKLVNEKYKTDIDDGGE